MIIFAEQIKATTIGSPVSGVIAEDTLQRLEDIAMSGYRPRFWAGYIDETFVIIERERLKSFQSVLNSVFPDIQFAMQEEKAQELPFLDVLIHRLGVGELSTSVYSEAINTDRILHFESYHPMAHRICCLKVLVNRIGTHGSTPAFFAMKPRRAKPFSL